VVYEPEEAARRALSMKGRLADRLQIVADDFGVRLGDYSRAIDAMVARLRAGDALAGVPGVGDIFPDFILPDTHGRLWRLADAVQDGTLVLSFHRGYWCDFCHLNMTALAEISARLAEFDCQIAAISPQNAEQSSALAAHAGAGFAVLCDVGMGVSTMLGLCAILDDDLRRQLDLLQVDLQAANVGYGSMMPITATFVLDRTGRVAARHVDPDPRLRMDCDAIVQAAVDLQSAARS
jgi:peroxiredoxin